MRPVIFLSAVSSELKSARQLVANTLTFLGYEPDWQDIFGTEQGDLREMLRRRIDKSKGVVQIVGRSYGAEPPPPYATFDRVSYTQYEALYARQRGKKVWYLLLDDTFPADPCEPEPEEKAQLQLAYRERVHGGNDLWHLIKDRAELKNAIYEIHDELARLRRRAICWAIAVFVLVLLADGGLLWLNHGQQQQGQQLTSIAEQQQKLLDAFHKFPEVVAQQTRPGNPGDNTEQKARAFAVLENEYGLPPGSLAIELPKLAATLLARADTSDRDRAIALFLIGKFADAETAALKASDKALVAAGKPIHDRINALGLAASSAREQFQHERALQHLRGAASLTSVERDPEEWTLVESSIGCIQLENGQYHDAETTFRKINTVCERIFSPEHPVTLLNRAFLADAVLELGDYVTAERENRAVLAIRERLLGPMNRLTLMSRNNLAVALARQGRNAEAERELRAVLTGSEALPGKGYPGALTSRNDLANVLRAQGKLEEAEKEHRTVLAIRMRMRGPRHPETLVSWASLATVLGAERKYAEAEKEFRGVLMVGEQVLGPEHPDVFGICANLALDLTAQKKWKEALEFAGRAEDGWLKTLGSEHPNYRKAKVLRERIDMEIKKE